MRTVAPSSPVHVPAERAEEEEEEEEPVDSAVAEAMLAAAMAAVEEEAEEAERKALELLQPRPRSACARDDAQQVSTRILGMNHAGRG